VTSDSSFKSRIFWRHDIQHDDPSLKDTQHYSKNVLLGVSMLSVVMQTVVLSNVVGLKVVTLRLNFFKND